MSKIEDIRRIEQAQRQRERDLIAADKAERKANQRREEANISVENGNIAAIQDSVMPPPDAQLSNGSWTTFDIEMERQAAYSAKGYRRLAVVQVNVLFHNGRLSEDAFKACRWYRDVYEEAGLEGSIPSTDYMKDVFTPPHSRTMFSDKQLEAQDSFRFVRERMESQFLPFFDAVTLFDMPMRRASRIMRCRFERANETYRNLSIQLTEAKATLDKDS